MTLSGLACSGEEKNCENKGRREERGRGMGIVGALYNDTSSRASLLRHCGLSENEDWSFGCGEEKQLKIGSKNDMTVVCMCVDAFDVVGLNYVLLPV